MYAAPVVPGNPMYETWIGAGCSANISFLAPCLNQAHVQPISKHKDTQNQCKAVYRQKNIKNCMLYQKATFCPDLKC